VSKSVSGRRLDRLQPESIVNVQRAKCCVAIFFAAYALCESADAVVILIDKGIFLAGPFGVPDIHKPPWASAEAVFLSGSSATAPYYLNEFVLNSDASAGQFSNNGSVNGGGFNVSIIQNGGSCFLSWNLSNTHFTVGYLSINFDNSFYHVYQIDDAVTLSTQVEVTGNSRDQISHVRFFGYRVPESSTSGVFLVVALAAIGLTRRLLT
jgi:hypothetical protein